MLELIRTNDIVLISRIEALLAGSDIHYFVADTFTSLVEGSIGIIPRRILVLGEDLPAARQQMIEAGLADELPR